MLHVFFNNTLSVKELAKRTILKECTGDETQSYKLGQKVTGNGFKEGEITEVYENNGFYYYVIEYKLKPRSRKTYTTTLRQTDITLI